MYEVEATADLLSMNPAGTPSNPLSAEARMVQAVLAGDRDVYGSLYELYAPLVHGILLARMPRGEVEDMVQEIFLHALKKLHTLRDANAFGPWIAMIARNRAMDFHRQSRQTVAVTEEIAGSETGETRAADILEEHTSQRSPGRCSKA